MTQQVFAVEGDIPYFTSPPLQFTFTQKATLTLGTYPFLATDRATIGNNKNITNGSLLFIKAFTFSADVIKEAYQSSLKLASGNTDVPKFSCFLQSESSAPIFVDPIELGDYASDQQFKRIIIARQKPNRLSAFFQGTLQQNAALAGVNEINLTMNIWVQLINDMKYIEAVKRQYGVRR